MIDWLRVRELRDEIGDAELDDVMAMFFEEFDESLAAIKPQNDKRAIEAAVHFLKGSALNIGFERVSALCSALEFSALDNLTCVTDIEMIASAYHESKSAYLAGLKVDREL